MDFATNLNVVNSFWIKQIWELQSLYWNKNISLPCKVLCCTNVLHWRIVINLSKKLKLIRPLKLRWSTFIGNIPILRWNCLISSRLQNFKLEVMIFLWICHFKCQWQWYIISYEKNCIVGWILRNIICFIDQKINVRISRQEKIIKKNLIVYFHFYSEVCFLIFFRFKSTIVGC